MDSSTELYSRYFLVFSPIYKNVKNISDCLRNQVINLQILKGNKFDANGN